MQATYCTNPNCRWHTEKKGGRFIFYGKDAFCPECSNAGGTNNCGKNLYKFKTTHFTGEPIEINGSAHLAALEKQYGAISVARNYDSNNWRPPQQGDTVNYKPVFGRRG